MSTTPTFWTRKRLLIAVAVVFVAGMIATGLGLRLGSRNDVVVVPPDSVAVLDADTGRFETSVSVGGEPGGVDVSTGSVWVANRADRTVSRIDLRSGALLGTIPVGVYPSAILARPGAVWVAGGPTGKLVRIDAASNSASRPRSAGAGCGGLEAAVTPGPRSTFWMVCGQPAGMVRVDLRSGAIAPFAVPAGVVAGSGTTDLSALAFGPPNGSLWIADRGRSRVTAIDPDTGRVRRQVEVGGEPAAIAVGSGWVWVVNARDSTVSRIEIGAHGSLPQGRDGQGRVGSGRRRGRSGQARGLGRQRRQPLCFPDR